MPKFKAMDSFLGRDHVEVSVYAHGQVNLYCKFSDALIQMDMAQWKLAVAFVEEAEAELHAQGEEPPLQRGAQDVGGC
jgi:hypothetical protein